ncbi:MAG TPA: hypothetical protein VK364_11830 [Hymenobacter sp.]|nr:hypothetical protein [Hymenobacter sp.]
MKNQRLQDLLAKINEDQAQSLSSEFTVLSDESSLSVKGGTVVGGETGFAPCETKCGTNSACQTNTKQLEAEVL